MKSLLDPTFVYVPAVQTDIRKTFARARRKIAVEAAKQQEQQPKVTQLKARAK